MLFRIPHLEIGRAKAENIQQRTRAMAHEGRLCSHDFRDDFSDLTNRHEVVLALVFQKKSAVRQGGVIRPEHTNIQQNLLSAHYRNLDRRDAFNWPRRSPLCKDSHHK